MELWRTHESPLKAPNGLVNLGNTCFLNSILQCLNVSVPFSDELLVVAESGLSASTLAASLCRVFLDIRGKGSCNGAVSPQPVLGHLISKFPWYRGGNQQDAHELLRMLLGSISEQTESRWLPIPSGTPSTCEKIIWNSFRGHYATAALCWNCHRVSFQLEPFLDISLDPLTTTQSAWTLSLAAANVPCIVTESRLAHASNSAVIRVLNKAIPSPGRYVICKRSPVTTENSRASSQIAELPVGSKVNVLEVLDKPVDKRIRGRIELEPGWVSIFEDGQSIFEEQKPSPAYYVICKKMPVTEDIDRASTTITELQVGTRVHVTTVEVTPVDDRIRARIESPAGWISLHHVDGEHVYALQIPSLGCQILRENICVTSGADLASDQIAELSSGTQVDVTALEVGPSIDEFRAQIASLSGWISIQHTDGKHTYAENVETHNSVSGELDANQLEDEKVGAQEACVQKGINARSNIKDTCHTPESRRQAFCDKARLCKGALPKVLQDVFDSSCSLLASPNTCPDLTECLQQLSNAEALEEDFMPSYECSHCCRQKGERCFASRRVFLWPSLPRLLTLHLKRFARRGRCFEKSSARVKTAALLDFSAFTINKELHAGLQPYFTPDSVTQSPPVAVNGLQYELYGVCVHQGSTMHSGHYIAYVNAAASLEEEKWYRISDCSVASCTREEVLEAEAYVAFYRRLDG